MISVIMYMYMYTETHVHRQLVLTGTYKNACVHEYNYKAITTVNCDYLCSKNEAFHLIKQSV